MNATGAGAREFSEVAFVALLGGTAGMILNFLFWIGMGWSSAVYTAGGIATLAGLAVVFAIPPVAGAVLAVEVTR